MKPRKEWDKSHKMPDLASTCLKVTEYPSEKNVRRSLIKKYVGKYLLFLKNKKLGKCLYTFEGLYRNEPEISNGYEMSTFVKCYDLVCEYGKLRVVAHKWYPVLDRVENLVSVFDSDEDIDTKILFYEITDETTKIDEYMTRQFSYFTRQGMTLENLAKDFLCIMFLEMNNLRR